MFQLGGTPDYSWENLSEPGTKPKKSSICIQMRRADGNDGSMAEGNARAAIAKIVGGASTQADYGLEKVDWAEAVHSGDVDLFHGVGYRLYAVELAMICGKAMRGVADENGNPAEWSRRNVALLFKERIPGAVALPDMRSIGTTFGDVFITIAMTPLRKAQAEGKSSAVAPSGNGATA